MAAGDKDLKDGDFGNALKEFAAAGRLAPDAPSAADATRGWDKAEAGLSDKIAAGLEGKTKGKTDLLVEEKVLRAQVEIYDGVKWYGDAVLAYNATLQRLDQIGRRQLDAPTAAQRKKLVDQLKNELSDVQKNQAIADTIYAKAVKDVKTAATHRDRCVFLYQVMDNAPDKVRCLAAAGQLKTAIDQLPKTGPR